MLINIGLLIRTHKGDGAGAGAVTDKFDDRAGREREGGSLDKDKSYDKWQALGLGE